LFSTEDEQSIQHTRMRELQAATHRELLVSSTVHYVFGDLCSLVISALLFLAMACGMLTPCMQAKLNSEGPVRAQAITAENHRAVAQLRQAGRQQEVSAAFAFDAISSSPCL
jgi:hypothetical protein